MLTVHRHYVYIYCPVAVLAKPEANTDAGFQSLQREGIHAWIGQVLADVCGEHCVNTGHSAC